MRNMHLNHFLLFAVGLYITFAFDDLSFQAVASQLPIYHGRPYSLYEASNALDRNTDTCMRTDDIGVNSPYQTVWWKVDLGGVYSIYSINIMFKSYDNLDDLSFQAFATQSPIFPTTSYYLYKASQAVDRNTTTCMRTDQIGPQSPQKSTWWKVDLGGVYNIFSINILFKEYENFEYRQRGRFAGFSIYVSNTGDIEGSTLCYKDRPQLPPLNFTTTCTEHGRYVIFYNERQNGVVYPDGYQLSTMFTELCEVIVKGCKKSSVYGTACDILCPIACKNRTCHIQNGECLECEPRVYGNYCNLSCPTNCKDNTCHTRNGTCYTCKPGWTGIYCKTKCTEGWYGVNCSQTCSRHCRDSTICNHVTGRCEKGCDTGWTGSLCIKECDGGTFGYDCLNNCSGHCLNGSTCNKQSGACDRGCNPGYTYTDCSKKCPPGHFGVACSERCSDHCINNEPCDHISGACYGGCQDGYLGARCFNLCTTGYYGTNCSIPCLPRCNGTCKHVDGSCKDFKEERIEFYQNVSSSTSWIIACTASLVVNCVLISGACLLCRGIYTKKVSISRDLFSRSKSNIYYTDTELDVKTGENSTYQELDLSREEIEYQNTTIR